MANGHEKITEELIFPEGVVLHDVVKTSEGNRKERLVYKGQDSKRVAEAWYSSPEGTIELAIMRRRYNQIQTFWFNVPLMLSQISEKVLLGYEAGNGQLKVAELKGRIDKSLARFQGDQLQKESSRRLAVGQFWTDISYLYSGLGSWFLLSNHDEVFGFGFPNNINNRSRNLVDILLDEASDDWCLLYPENLFVRYSSRF